MTVARGDLFEEYTVLHDDRTWLAVALAVAGLVYLIYLATHSYPAYGAGLFMEIAEQIRAHGYGLPERIPGYTAEGVPFAYPPLMFYVAAVVVELTGIGAFTYSQVLPGLVVVASIIPYYYTARELLGTAPRAGFATIVYATAPEALQWHLSAGGIVRAPAMLLALTGAYVGIRLFRDRDRRWLGPAIALFGLTVLTHPHYTAFFGLTYIVLYTAYDRTIRGLLGGALVAAGGLALAAPWWIQVALTHGPDVFLAASGTHSGLLGGISRIGRVFWTGLGVPMLFYLGVLMGLAYGLVRRRYFLVAWFVASGYIVGKPRFLFVAGSMLLAVLVFDGVIPMVRDRAGDGWVVPVTVALALMLVSTGVVFASGSIDAHGGSTQPAFVDADDVAAMEWAEENTDESATFVVLGDTAEWFPQQTDRTILVGPWGVEWTTPERYHRQLSLFRDLSYCHTEECLTTGLRNAHVDPEYVYVPKDTYTVRGSEAHQLAGMRTSLIASGRYDLVYENEGVMVFREDGDWDLPSNGFRA